MARNLRDNSDDAWCSQLCDGSRTVDSRYPLPAAAPSSPGESTSQEATMPIDLSEVGAAVSTGAGGAVSVRFGLYLPGITFDGGYRLQVKVIHEQDQFVREIPPVTLAQLGQRFRAGPMDDDGRRLAGGPGHFGDAGTYVYRFQLLRAAADGDPR